MSRDQTRFYIPQTQLWNWEHVSPLFVKLQLERARQSYRDTEQVLVNVEADLENINREILSEWAQGSIQVMRAFEARYKEVRRENKRVMYCRKLLREVMDKMIHFLENTGNV